MTQPNKPRCETCWHWQRFSASSGECQRFMNDEPEMHEADDWCGEYQDTHDDR